MNQIELTKEEKEKVIEFLNQGTDIGFAMDVLSSIGHTEFDEELENPEEYEDWRLNCLGFSEL